MAASRFLEEINLWSGEENLIRPFFLNLGAALLGSESGRNVLYDSLNMRLFKISVSDPDVCLLKVLRRACNLHPALHLTYHVYILLEARFTQREQ